MLDSNSVKHYITLALTICNTVLYSLPCIERYILAKTKSTAQLCMVHSVHCTPNPSQVPSYLKHCGAIIAVNPLLPHHHLMIINYDGDDIRKLIMIRKATLLVVFFLGFVWDSLPSLSTFPNCLRQVVFSSIPYYMHAEGSML